MSTLLTCVEKSLQDTSKKQELTFYLMVKVCILSPDGQKHDRVFFLPLLFNVVLDISARAVKGENNMKGMQTRKGRSKTIFIWRCHDPVYRKFCGYKINIKTQSNFCTFAMKHKIKKTIPIYDSIENNKVPRNKLYEKCTTYTLKTIKHCWRKVEKTPISGKTSVFMIWKTSYC